jgi:hypothetical protein
MRRSLVVAGIWFATCAVSDPRSDATMVRTPEARWYLLPQVEARLAKKYRDTQKDSLSLEYIACLPYVVQDRPDGTRFYLIHNVRFPEQQAWIERDPFTNRIINYRVAASCDFNELHLHTHSRVHCLVLKAPRTCETPEGWKYPSGLDLRNSTDHPLAFIQYGERSLLGYAPDSVPLGTLRRQPSSTRRQ